MRQSLQRQSADFLHHHLGHGHPSFCLGFSFPSWCLFSLLLWSLLSLLTWRLVSFEVSSKVSLLQDLGRPHHQNPRWHWTLHQQGLLPVCVSSLFHHLFFLLTFLCLLFFGVFSFLRFLLLVLLLLTILVGRAWRAVQSHTSKRWCCWCCATWVPKKQFGKNYMAHLVCGTWSFGENCQKSQPENIFQVTASWCGLLCPWPCRRWSFC